MTQPPEHTGQHTGKSTGFTRRDFLLRSATGAAALAAGISSVSAQTYTGGSDEIRVGLIGCGGRGTGAAKDAARAAKGVRIVAMADLFQDELDESKGILKEMGEQYSVGDGDSFVGFDAYKQVINHPDVNYVILATPPGFRPEHFRETIAAGKHVFFEKPVAVDPTGVRSIIETGKLADEKKVSVVTGTIYRRVNNFVEGINLVKSGEIGKPVSGFAYYMAGPGWVKLADDNASEMEKQCRNWMHYPWLAGDHIVEQSVHNIDVLHWLFGAPKSAYATGGKMSLIQEEIYGPSYDHFSVEYVFEPDVRVQFTSRKIANTDTRVANRIVCEKGVADINPGRTQIRTHDGKTILDVKAEGNGYVQEHADLIEAIRSGKHLNESQQIAESTLAAIMGRESAYSGKLVEWDWALNESQQKLGPDTHAFGPAPHMDVPRPGEYKLS